MVFIVGRESMREVSLKLPIKGVPAWTKSPLNLGTRWKRLVLQQAHQQSGSTVNWLKKRPYGPITVPQRTFPGKRKLILLGAGNRTTNEETLCTDVNQKHRRGGFRPRGFKSFTKSVLATVNDK